MKVALQKVFILEQLSQFPRNQRLFKTPNIAFMYSALLTFAFFQTDFFSFGKVNNLIPGKKCSAISISKAVC